jgi:hypothetical protein
MTRKRLVTALAVCFLFAASPGGGAMAAATVRLVISHVVSHCHVWTLGTKTLGASTRLVVTRGTRLVIRSDCPMDFDFTQTLGPRLALSAPRTYAGSERVIVFRTAGLYRLVATNVQMPEQRGLVTLGPPNTLQLTVIVTR